MDKDTVDLLMQFLGNLLKSVAENDVKLVALESMLEQHSPEIYQEYQDQMVALRRRGAGAINLAAFSNLQSKLLQE